MIQKINYNKKFWQEWKRNQPHLNKYLNSVAIGMIISDATIQLHGKYAYIKFEQSKMQYFFIYNLFYLFKSYTFSSHINVRLKKNEIKSFYFKTFTHQTFLNLYNKFYINGKKIITKDLILNEIDYVALAYWIMGDGSFKNKENTLILHTEGFSKENNELISLTLNEKFNIHSYIVKSHIKSTNKTYYLIYIPNKDKNFIIKNISPHILQEFKYKVNYK